MVTGVVSFSPLAFCRQSYPFGDQPFFFFGTLLLSSFWTNQMVTGVVSFPPPRFLPLIFYGALRSAIPLLVDFSSSVANSPSRAFRKSICAREKVPANGTELLKRLGLSDNILMHRCGSSCLWDQGTQSA